MGSLMQITTESTETMPGDQGRRKMMVRQIAFSFDNKHYLPSDTDNSAKSPSCPVSTVNPGVEIKHLCDTDDIEM